MMKLSLMQKVAETVDHEWRSPLAEMILENWEYDARSVFYLRASSNFIFIFSKDGKKRYLRFNEAGERDKGLIDTEIELLHYLKSKSLNVSVPVLSKNERYIETVETKIGTFHAVVFEGLPGKHLEMDIMSEEYFYEWGKLLGELHQSFKQLPEHIKNGRESWRAHLSALKKLLPKEKESLLKEWSEIEEWCEKLPVTNENFGLIHYDFELDNLCWDDMRAGILDFDDCAQYWYAADIVYALRDFIDGNERSGKSPAMEFFLKGYNSMTFIDESILKELSWFTRMHALVMYGKLSRCVDIGDSFNQPEWLKDLRVKLVRKLEALEKDIAKQRSCFFNT